MNLVKRELQQLRQINNLRYVRETLLGADEETTARRVNIPLRHSL